MYGWINYWITPWGKDNQRESYNKCDYGNHKDSMNYSTTGLQGASQYHMTIVSQKVRFPFSTVRQNAEDN